METMLVTVLHGKQMRRRSNLARLWSAVEDLPGQTSAEGGAAARGSATGC